MTYRQVKQALTTLFVFASLSCSAHAQVLRIGVIAPLTGGGAVWGMAAAEAPQIIAARINAKGGLLVGAKRYPIKVIAYDDHYKAADCLAAYNRLVNEDRVRYLILLDSPGTMAVKPDVERDKILTLTSATTPNALDANTHYMFRIFSVALDYLPGAIAWIHNNYQQRRIVIVNPNDETGWSQDKMTVPLFRKNGFDVVSHPLYDRSQANFQPLFTRIIAEKPDVIDLGTTPPATAGLMLRQARELGYTGLFIKTGGAAPHEMVKVAGKKAAEGLVTMLFADPDNAAYRKLADEYVKDVGHKPNAVLVPFYDAVNVLLRAIQNAGTVSNTGIVAKAIPNVLPMKSLLGDTLTLGGVADHQIMTVNFIGVIKNGLPRVVAKIG